ncbi:hypothetical protein [Streptomyces tritici]|uniref:hypothetical protein n=1 Tax=Streptomyces tritici TaxID=2054410 RepID=UPI003AF01443
MRADLRNSLTAVAVALALTAPAVPAFADTATVGIGRATTFDHQRGAFQVSAWTDAPDSTVTSVSARIRKGDRVLVELPALTASEAAGYYQLPAETPLKLTEDGGQLPELGRYSIDVTAEDSKGNKLTRLDAGTLDFTLRPQATFAVAAPAWTDPVARPKGSLTGIQPGSGDAVPLAGRTVRVSARSEESAQTVAVAADGTFAAEPYRVTTNHNLYDLAFSEDSDEVHGTLKLQHDFYSVTARPVTVTGAVDKARVLPGEPFAIRGRVVAEDDGTPLAGTQVRVNSGGMVRLVTTDADGRYSALFKGAPWKYAGHWYVSTTDVFLEGSAGGQVVMPGESHIEKVQGSLAADTTVTMTGRLEYTYPSDITGIHTEPMRLEHSADGRTGWKVIGTGEASAGSPFTVTGRSTGGWFRVHHPATDTMAESFGPAVRLGRIQTRVVSVNAAPEPVRKGATVTVTGGLQQYKNGAWTLYAGQPVGLWFQAKGSSAYKLVASGKSAANGGVSLKTTATVDGTYLIRYLGTSTSTHFHSSAVGDFVDVL